MKESEINLPIENIIFHLLDEKINYTTNAVMSIVIADFQVCAALFGLQTNHIKSRLFSVRNFEEL